MASLREKGESLLYLNLLLLLIFAVVRLTVILKSVSFMQQYIFKELFIKCMYIAICNTKVMVCFCYKVMFILTECMLVFNVQIIKLFQFKCQHSIIISVLPTLYRHPIIK